MDVVFKFFNLGDEVVFINDFYGGFYCLMIKVYECYGIKFIFVDFNDLDVVCVVILD